MSDIKERISQLRMLQVESEERIERMSQDLSIPLKIVEDEKQSLEHLKNKIKRLCDQK